MARLLAGAATDTGRVRDHNEDQVQVAAVDSPEVREHGFLIAVADGMGGHERGEIASQLAIETLFASYYAATTTTAGDVAQVLQDAFQAANQRILKETVETSGQTGGMGTTMVAAAVVGNHLTVANVGDSRAYLIRADKANQLTNDHSLVAEQVASGTLTEEEARNSNYRNVITRALGHRPKIDTDIFEIPLLPDDRVVLVSDGVHGSVEADEIKTLALEKSPQDASAALISLALQHGSTDNVTAAIFAFAPETADETALVPAGGARGVTPLMIILFLVILIAVVLSLLYFTGVFR